MKVLTTNPSLLACLATLVFLCTSGAPARAAAEPVLKIGVSLGLSGRYAEMALMQKRGYELWQESVNQTGGLRGRTVEMVIRDDQSSPERAREVYGEFVLDPYVELLFGPYSSELTAAVADLTERHGVPLLAAGAASDSLWEHGYRYLFGMYTPATKYVVGFLELVTEQGLDNLAILYADDAFSRRVAQGAETWAGRYGLRVAYRAALEPGAEDLVPWVRGAEAAGAQVLVVCGHYGEALRVQEALAQTQWRPEAHYAAVGPALPAYRSALGAVAEAVFSSSQWVYHERLPLEGSAAFYRSFRAAYGEPPSYQAAAAFAAGQVLEAAIRKVGSVDREQLREVLSSMNFTSIIGRYGVDNTGRQTRHFMLVVQWQAGKQEVVWPEELQTAPPLWSRGKTSGSARQAGARGDEK